MSNYTKTTDFEAKDSLPSGDSGKIIRGSEFETEFDNIAIAIASKSDANNPTFTGTVTIDGLTVNGNTVLGNAATDTVTVTADIASNLIPSADDTYNLGASGAEWNDLFIDGTANIDSLVADTADINGGTVDGVTIGGSSAGAITGTTITGTSFVTSGDMTFGDNDKAIFGAGSDLQIYHDGGNSRILENGTGFLAVGTNGTDIRLTGNSFTEFMAKFEQDGPVTLYHNNSAKLATTPTGIDVTGTVTADGLTVEKDNESMSTFYRPNSSEAAAFNVNFDFNTANGTQATFAQLRADNDGNANGSQDGALSIRTAKSGSLLTRFKADENGDISFYEDTGTTAKFVWDASAEALGIGTSSPNNLIHVEASDNGDGITIQRSSLTSGDYGQLSFNQSTNDAGTPNVWIRGHRGSSFDTSYMTLGTGGATGTERMRIDSSGNVLVSGTEANPAQNNTTDAVALHNVGLLRASTTNSAAPLDLNVKSRDGDIATFRKDGSTVGSIGTSGGSLDVYSSTTDRVGLRLAQAVIPMFNGAASPNTVDLGTNTRQFKDLYLSGGLRGDTLTFSSNAGDEAMRIDSSGNVLVGKTSQSFSTEGCELLPNKIQVTRDGGVSLALNRKTSDGAIQTFSKDGSSVGSIGVGSGDLHIYSSASGHKGLRFGLGYIAPANNSGAVDDNNVDLGYGGGSPTRFKDLYLSGGAYLGGTAAANKLDDYEEGTWSPVLAGVTSGTYSGFTVTAAKYTKIGNTVHAMAYLTAVDISAVTLSGAVKFTGLPFSTATTGIQVANVSFANIFTYDEIDRVVSGLVTGSEVRLLKGSATNAVQDSELDNTQTSGTIMFQVTYFTAS
jgi:hypothetical protein